MTLIYDKPANYTQDMKATVAKPSPRGDGHYVMEVEPKDAEGNQLFTGENPGVVTVNGSLVANETNKAVTANTNILAANYTADGNKSSLLMVLTNTPNVLSLLVDGVSGTLNSGIALDAGKWYAFEIPITYQSTYNLQSSVSATMQIKWVVR